MERLGIWDNARFKVRERYRDPVKDTWINLIVIIVLDLVGYGENNEAEAGDSNNVLNGQRLRIH